MLYQKKSLFFLILVFALSLNACSDREKDLSQIDNKKGVGTQSFRNRLNEGWSSLDSSHAPHYARSTHSLQTFRNRLNEGQSLGSLAVHYAASTHSL